MFLGVEHDLLLFNIFFYCTVDLIFKNTFVSLITTWIVDEVLKQIRSYFGESNISKKALVDTRFLL